MDSNIKHDPDGMYLVRETGESCFDVYQKSSGVVVASPARKDTACEAAQALNACAVVPRMVSHSLYVTIHSTDIALRDWIGKEIRLAMQQEPNIKSGIDRAGVADARAARILTKLDGHDVDPLTKIPADWIEQYVKHMVPSNK